MKQVGLLALAFLAGISAASATDRPVHSADPEFLHSLLQQKLNSGIPGPMIAIDVDNPGKPLSNGWHYLDARNCGWYYNSGAPEFYVYSGHAVIWDVGADPALATALAIPCVAGSKLGYHIIDGVHYDKTESFTSP
jgi:hypothetical protein